MVCQLVRSLYGIKKATTIWYQTIRPAFKKMGFCECRADPCLFVQRHDNGKSLVYIILYVDDLFIGCKTNAEADEICAELGSQFTVKSFEEARFVHGMGIQLLVRQAQFTAKMWGQFSLQDCNAVRNPMVLDQDLSRTRRFATSPSTISSLVRYSMWSIQPHLTSALLCPPCLGFPTARAKRIGVQHFVCFGT
ncbi:hypothetical protein PC110_g7151 [Phytophthora cactorum]|uniref:Reverse transcriptase Ty1/copia-type domain-containing protein n=1 Tax=Phytophthora cactorum TaxID=29920 RepID=A0A329SLX1_9STRA|nr:hypothetical protein PC110_g7151 [Phytophthora cactorum]